MNPRRILCAFALCLLAIATCNTANAQGSKADKKVKAAQAATTIKSSAAAATTKSDAATASKSDEKTALVDINSATKAELMKVPGIGTRYSDDIIKGRPYKNKRQLLTKKVLTETVYNSVSDKIIAKQK